MYDKKTILVNYIKDKLKALEELNKKYSEDKINKLADNLVSTNKPLEELYALIDNKFAYQARKIAHNNHLLSLKEYYLANIEELKKGNNCYMLSYQQGGKVLEQAFIEDTKELNLNLTVVNINNKKIGYKKPNSKSNDYELIMSDIAYLLGVDYAKTYRLFDAKMNPVGILNESMASRNEIFLNFEEMFKYIREESNKFTLKSEIIDYHDKKIKRGLKRVSNKNDYKENIEYVLKMFKALPDITKDNVLELRKDFLEAKIFELLTNSLNNNLTHYGILIRKDKNKGKYYYRLAPLFNKSTISMPDIKDNETICNFFIVSKRELLHTLMTSYYKDINEIVTLIIDNKDTLLPLFTQLIKEHLDYEEFKKYIQILASNLAMIEVELLPKKKVSPDSLEDKMLHKENNNKYRYRISPYLQNYDYDDFDEEIDNKGNVVLLSVVAIVMIITLIIIGIAIYAISKVEI